MGTFDCQVIVHHLGTIIIRSICSILKTSFSYLISYICFHYLSNPCVFGIIASVKALIISCH